MRFAVAVMALAFVVLLPGVFAIIVACGSLLAWQRTNAPEASVVRPRFTTGSMLLAMAVIAVAFAAIRIGGFVVVAACVALLAWKRTSDGIARGLATNSFQKSSLLLSSLVVAMVIIGLSDLTFLAAYHGYMWHLILLNVMNHFRPYEDEGHIMVAVAVALPTSLCVAALLRRLFWPIRGASIASSFAASASGSGIESEAGRRLILPA